MQGTPSNIDDVKSRREPRNLEENLGTCFAMYKRVFADVGSGGGAKVGKIREKVIDRDKDNKVDFREFDESLENLNEEQIMHLTLFVKGQQCYEPPAKGSSSLLLVGIICTLQVYYI